jgi:hypothetical protein
MICILHREDICCVEFKRHFEVLAYLVELWFLKCTVFQGRFECWVFLSASLCTRIAGAVDSLEHLKLTVLKGHKHGTILLFHVLWLEVEIYLFPILSRFTTKFSSTLFHMPPLLPRDIISSCIFHNRYGGKAMWLCHCAGLRWTVIIYQITCNEVREQRRVTSGNLSIASTPEISPNTCSHSVLCIKWSRTSQRYLIWHAIVQKRSREAR